MQRAKKKTTPEKKDLDYHDEHAEVTALEDLERVYVAIRHADRFWQKHIGGDWRRPGIGLPFAGFETRFPWPVTKYPKGLINKAEEIKNEFILICRISQRILSGMEKHIKFQVIEQIETHGSRDSISNHLQQRLLVRKLLRSWKLDDLDNVICLLQSLTPNDQFGYQDRLQTSAIDTQQSGRFMLQNIANQISRHHPYMKGELAKMSGCAAATYRRTHEIMIKENFLRAAVTKRHPKFTATIKLLSLKE